MPLLARLEHEFDGAGQLVAVTVQQVHRLDQHCGMRVMPAGMHAAGDFAGKVEPGLLRHRQCVHVAAQQDGAAGLRPRLSAGQRDDEPRGRRSAGNFHIETLQSLEHRRGRARQVEPQLRFGVNAPAQRHGGRQQLARLVEKTVQFGHDRLSLCRSCRLEEQLTAERPILRPPRLDLCRLAGLVIRRQLRSKLAGGEPMSDDEPSSLEEVAIGQMQDPCAPDHLNRFT